MSFVTVYAGNAGLCTYTRRGDAVRAAVMIAIRHPALSADVGIAELNDTDGAVISAFVSASEMLASEDADAIAAADANTSQVSAHLGVVAWRAAARAAHGCEEARLRSAIEAMLE